MTMRLFPFVLAALLIAMPLAGCTMGPDYDGPPRVLPGTGSSSAFARADAAQQVGETVLAQWWMQLGDPLLNRLESEALEANPQVAIAEARVRQARAKLRSTQARTMPTIAATTGARYQNIPLDSLGFGSTFSGSGESNSHDRIESTTYNAGFDASWELDLFGKAQRATEAKRGLLQAAEADMEDARVQLTAEVARTYIALRGDQAQLAEAERQVALQRESLGLSRQRRDQGVLSDLDIDRLESDLHAAEARIAPLKAEGEAFMDALAVLTGQVPGSLDMDLADPAAIPLPPAQVSVGDPSALLRRRPDIRAAERRLAAATANIGLQEAARMPQISLTGLLGLGGSTIGALFDTSEYLIRAEPTLSWNLLDFGAGAANVEEAKGVREEIQAQYRQSVLAALQDAEDSLTRFGHQRSSLADLARASQSADRAAARMRERYNAGSAALTDLLDAQRQQALASQNLAMATANLSIYYVALQKSLGLGWQDDAEPEAGTPIPQ